jgi:hypothetical protein
MLSLGQRPRIRRIRKKPALKARLTFATIVKVGHRFRRMFYLGSRTSHRNESRFQRWLTRLLNPWGDAPGGNDIAPMARIHMRDAGARVGQDMVLASESGRGDLKS